MRRFLVNSVCVLGLVGAAGSAATGCLSRPVANGQPTTKESFSSSVTQKSIDKVDILFMIDNSASMGDKTRYLRKAIPDLLSRLISPNCVDAKGEPLGTTVDAAGKCAQGAPEFPPVHDMHIGVVTSALGPRLSDKNGNPLGVVCAEYDPNNSATQIVIKGQTFDRHNNDRGRLINRGGDTEAAIVKMQPSNFLYWYPQTEANTAPPGAGATRHTDRDALTKDFTDLIAGVREYGCGIESQLESWYRFLIQPDPYSSLTLVDGKAVLQGVDTEILKQRRDFLRPDSLVAVIALTDENDSEIDIRAFGGQAHNFLNAVWTPPRGTSSCENDPTSAQCMSCAFPAASGDPNCAEGPYTAKNDWGFDVNLRHIHMKQKYGLDVQFPIERYQLGLTSKVVPDRVGEYPTGASSYQGLVAANQTCTNPLFAKELPDVSKLSEAELTSDVLCKLAPGNRSADLVFYAHIGGVPWQLLVDDPTAATPTVKKQPLAESDWTPILGTDPSRYDYTGIDPHMIESQAPRSGLPGPSDGNTDPIHGRDWLNNASDKKAGDRQYACTFELEETRDCTSQERYIQDACDCPDTDTIAKEQVAPVCNPSKPSQQVKGKTYPTIRELHLAKLLRSQGIVASMCPIHPKEQGAGDPLYGYRPAMKTIIDRLKDKLSGQCLPRKLTIQNERVQCLVLEQLPDEGPQASACQGAGFKQPEADVLARYMDQRVKEWEAGGRERAGADPRLFPVCEVVQLTPGVDCRPSSDAGWCYVEGVGQCSQSIFFSETGTPKSGARIELVCIQETGGGGADGG